MDVGSALHRYFGHDSFRTGQQALVDTVLEGRDLLAVMPTGSGKSLGFQLPAVLLPGLTLVVSPLISLMKDQVDELNRRGIHAAALHSQASPDLRRAALRAARAGELKLLYVAPERFVAEAQESGATVVALSGLLTVGYDAMRDTVAALQSAGLRPAVRVMIGGGPIDDDVRKYTGADAWGADAQAAVTLAGKWLEG